MRLTCSGKYFDFRLQYNFFIENNLKEESDKLLADYISQCNDIINELPDEIQGGLNELISYIIKRNK